ncbi:Uncharacterised protein [uncultured archaeon]|nr:Uncharacterised protein [uncultured archaeon]
MVTIEVLEGLKQAIARGESLQRAMQSFTNAGYSQEEVEEASHYLQTGVMPTPQPIMPQQPTLQKFPPLPTPSISQPPTPLPSQPPQQLAPQAPQQKNIGTGWIILLIVVLVILVGALFGILFFKDSLTTFFNSLGF